MKTPIFLFLLGTTLLTCSCQSATEKPAEEPVDTTTEVHSDHEHPALEVQLNDGKRWEADASTKAGIEQMQTLVADYQKGNMSEVSTLLEKLQGAFSDIFAQCSMKGPAHDQLHNYLFPLKERFDHLESCEGADCDDHLQELEQYLESFSTYFQ